MIPTLRLRVKSYLYFRVGFKEWGFRVLRLKVESLESTLTSSNYLRVRNFGFMPDIM